MTEGSSTIERLNLPASEGDVRGLARLLVDAIDSGAAVSFLGPLGLDDAEGWWRDTLANLPPRGIVLVARHDGEIVGSVQLLPAWAPNQPYRGEIVKLLVDRAARRRGLGTKLMKCIEIEAARGGFRLLTLDAKRGAEAERLYRTHGWQLAGTIPRFALDPDGVTPHDAVIFYKELRPVDDGLDG
jgi:GNAT superfamily N-acetyltransferase